MEKNNPRFYYALGALSLFALALFQGAQFFTSQYESQVLGLSTGSSGSFGGFQNFRPANNQNARMPAGVPTMSAMPQLPADFDMTNWQSYLNTSGNAGNMGNVMGNSGNRQSIRTKLGLGNGISCSTAMEIFETLCADGNITASEAVGAAQGYADTLRGQAAAQDPRGAQGGQYLQQYLPSGMPSRNVSPAAATQSIGAQRNGPLANGLSCNVIQKLLDDQKVCADGNISREEIRAVSSAIKADLAPSGRPSRALPSGAQPYLQCTFCGSGCAFITPDTACTQVAPEPGARCVIQGGNCVKVGGGV